jgi:hypothetical protein
LLAADRLLAYGACVESENTPEDAAGEPDRPVSARRPPGPRSGRRPDTPEAPAQTRASEPPSGTAEIPTTEARPAPPRPADVRPIDPRSADGRSSDLRPIDGAAARGRERRAADVRVPDARTGDGLDVRGDFRDGRPAAAEPTVPTNIYRARRPAVAIFLIIPALAVGFLLVRALAISAFGKPFLIDGVIASSLALASLPLLVAGLYGLITGAAHGAEQWGFRVWAKPPLAYLVVGIAFELGASIAIR